MPYFFVLGLFIYIYIFVELRGSSQPILYLVLCSEMTPGNIKLYMELEIQIKGDHMQGNET